MTDQILKIIREKKNSPWWLKAEKKVIAKYGYIFHPDNLDNLTKEDFLSFLLFKKNLHWYGISRQQKSITLDMSKLNKTLAILLDESEPIEKRLDYHFLQNNIKGLARAVITPILLVVYPDKYGVWNSMSETALKKLGLFPEFQRKDSFSQKYKKINRVLNELKNKYSITLWQLDGVLGESVGHGPFHAVVNEDININCKKRIKVETISEEVRFCKYCGKRIDADSIFCFSCGKKIISTPEVRKITDSRKLEFNSREELFGCAEFVNNNYRLNDKAFLYYKEVISFHKKFNNIKKLLRNEEFLQTIHKTLKAWNMNQRGARLKSLFDIKKSILNLENDIFWLSEYKLNSLKEIELKEVLNRLKKVFLNLKPMKSKTQIVGTSKLLQFLLPNLVMPIDRKYTLNFFSPNRNYWKDIEDEFNEFKKVFMAFYKYAKKFNLTEKDVNIQTWNASVPKIIDNAIIGIQKI